MKLKDNLGMLTLEEYCSMGCAVLLVSMAPNAAKC